MICKRCGTVLEDSAKFCGHCGAKITQENINNFSDNNSELPDDLDYTEKIDTDTVNKINQDIQNRRNSSNNNQYNNYPQQKNQTDPDEKNSNKAIVAALIAVSVAALLFVIVFFFLIFSGRISIGNSRQEPIPVVTEAPLPTVAPATIAPATAPPTNAPTAEPTNAPTPDPTAVPEPAYYNPHFSPSYAEDFVYGSLNDFVRGINNQDSSYIYVYYTGPEADQELSSFKTISKKVEREEVLSLACYDAKLISNDTATVIRKSNIRVYYKDGSVKDIPETYQYTLKIYSDGSMKIVDLNEL